MTSRTARLMTAMCAMLALVVTSPCLGAQTIDTVPEPRDAAKLALVRELMLTANFRQQLVQTIRESSVRQGAMLPLPAGFWEKFLARAEQDADTLLAPMAADYAKYFSTTDLRALIAFYKSPAGQRLSFVAPVISANSSAAGSQWGARVGMEVSAELSSGTGSSDAKAKAAKKP